MQVALVAAVARNGVIGRDGALPWHLPDDLKRFKALTLGHAVIMGRKTFASIGKPLPGRQNIVLSRDPAFAAAGCDVARSIEDALAAVKARDVAYVIGGEQVYAAAFPLASELDLTRVEADVPGDARFPDFDPAQWVVVARESHPADARHAHAFTFETLHRA